MPADFDRCVEKKNHRIITKQLPGGKYQYICYDDEGEHKGHIHKKGEEKKNNT